MLCSFGLEYAFNIIKKTDFNQFLSIKYPILSALILIRVNFSGAFQYRI